MPLLCRTVDESPRPLSWVFSRHFCSAPEWMLVPMLSLFWYVYRMTLCQIIAYWIPSLVPKYSSRLGDMIKRYVVTLLLGASTVMLVWTKDSGLIPTSASWWIFGGYCMHTDLLLFILITVFLACVPGRMVQKVHRVLCPMWLAYRNAASARLVFSYGAMGTSSLAYHLVWIVTAFLIKAFIDKLCQMDAASQMSDQTLMICGCCSRLPWPEYDALNASSLRTQTMGCILIYTAVATACSYNHIKLLHHAPSDWQLCSAPLLIPYMIIVALGSFPHTHYFISSLAFVFMVFTGYCIHRAHTFFLAMPSPKHSVEHSSPKSPKSTSTAENSESISAS